MTGGRRASALRAIGGRSAGALLAGLLGAAAARPPLAAQEPARMPDSAITAAEHAARSWFALLADANYDAAWEQSSRYFREHVSREQWRVNASRLDRQFRRANQRKLVEARWLRDEPPLLPAEYVVLRWLTVIDEFRQVGERVIMTHEADGGWRTATYDLFPNVDGDPIAVHGFVRPDSPPPRPQYIAPPKRKP